MDTPATMGMDTLYLHWEATDNLPFVLKGNTQLFPFLVVQPEKDSRLDCLWADAVKISHTGISLNLVG